MSEITAVDITTTNPPKDSVLHLRRWMESARETGHSISLETTFGVSASGNQLVLIINASFLDLKAAAWFKLTFA